MPNIDRMYSCDILIVERASRRAAPPPKKLPFGFPLSIPPSGVYRGNPSGVPILKEVKKMEIFDLVCKGVGLVLSSLNIWDKIHTYRKNKKPINGGRQDGLNNESEDS